MNFSTIFRLRATPRECRRDFAQSATFGESAKYENFAGETRNAISVRLPKNIVAPAHGAFQINSSGEH